MTDQLLKTPCHDCHVERGGRMVDFAGWSMPVQYSSIVEEHHAVRNAAGLFDIAHMGRLKFTGPDAARLLDRVLTNDVAGLEVDQIRYALVTNLNGGVLDDVLVYRLPDSYLLVVNASNREKIAGWIDEHREDMDAEMTDLTHEHAMFALQGPRAEGIVAPLTEANLESLRYYRCLETRVGKAPALVSRTGYTGEDGFELIVAAEEAPSIWKQLLESGRRHDLSPAGLGARDTLRLEAAMPLYGHELDEETNPYQAGLGFAVKLEKGEFLGRAALLRLKDDPTQPRCVGLEIEGRRIAREGFTLLDGGEPAGCVTSGTFSPTLQKSIAMAYVDPAHAAVATPLEVDIRGRRAKACVVELPFYKRKRG